MYSEVTFYGEEAGRRRSRQDLYLGRQHSEHFFGHDEFPPHFVLDDLPDVHPDDEHVVQIDVRRGRRLHLAHDPPFVDLGNDAVPVGVLGVLREPHGHVVGPVAPAQAPAPDDHRTAVHHESVERRVGMHRVDRVGPRQIHRAAAEFRQKTVPQRPHRGGSFGVSPGLRRPAEHQRVVVDPTRHGDVPRGRNRVDRVEHHELHARKPAAAHRQPGATGGDARQPLSRVQRRFARVREPRARRRAAVLAGPRGSVEDAHRHRSGGGRRVRHAHDAVRAGHRGRLARHVADGDARVSDGGQIRAGHDQPGAAGRGTALRARARQLGLHKAERPRGHEPEDHALHEVRHFDGALDRGRSTARVPPVFGASGGGRRPQGARDRVAAAVQRLRENLAAAPGHGHVHIRFGHLDSDPMVRHVDAHRGRAGPPAGKRFDGPYSQMRTLHSYVSGVAHGRESTVAVVDHPVFVDPFRTDLRRGPQTPCQIMDDVRGRPRAIQTRVGVPDGVSRALVRVKRNVQIGLVVGPQPRAVEVDEIVTVYDTAVRDEQHAKRIGRHGNVAGRFYAVPRDATVEHVVFLHVNADLATVQIPRETPHVVQYFNFDGSRMIRERRRVVDSEYRALRVVVYDIVSQRPFRLRTGLFFQDPTARLGFRTWRTSLVLRAVNDETFVGRRTGVGRTRDRLGKTYFNTNKLGAPNYLIELVRLLRINFWQKRYQVPKKNNK